MSVTLKMVDEEEIGKIIEGRDEEVALDGS